MLNPYHSDYLDISSPIFHSSEPAEAFSIANISATQKSTHSEDPSTVRSTEAQSTVVSTKTHSTINSNRSPTVGRDSVRSENKENVSSDTPSEPLFRQGRNVTRSEVKPGAFNSKYVHRRGHPKVMREKCYSIHFMYC